MSVLSILLMLLGVVLTFALKQPGYIVGPSLAIAGILMFRQEINKRRPASRADINATSTVPPRRPRRRRLLIAAGCIVVAFAAIFALALRLTAGLAGAADGFLAAMKAHDLNKAKTYLAEDFRASTTDEELEQFIQRSALAHYARSSWASREVKNNLGFLEGSALTDTGGTIPLKLSLVREKDAWKIYSITKPDAGLTSSQPRQKPATADQVRLIKGSTHALADAVTRRDFHAFYAGVAGIWQRQMTPEKFQTTFQSLIDSGNNFLVLDRLDPSIVSANIDVNGLLELTARYATTPRALVVENKYLYEGLDWKLIGLHVSNQ